MNLNQLVVQIRGIDLGLRQATYKAINRSLTLRNWLIGHYIVAFEQDGEDRAQYGEKLIPSLSEGLDSSGFSPRNLRLYRQFFLVYPQLAIVVPENVPQEIWQSPIAKLLFPDNQANGIWQSPIAKSPELPEKLLVPPRKLFSQLSFTHFSLLVNIEDPLQRCFYEIEAIKNTWSVSQMKRCINTMVYERSAFANNPGLLLEQVEKQSHELPVSAVIRDNYTFEFLGLNENEALEETDLENALLNHLQSFILELGHGFCFEGRQKRLLIGDEYYYVDLVFYHRILKCHVLFELKIDSFSTFNAGQLQTYLNFYKCEVMTEGDNPPVGILLVTGKNDALVKYATMSMDQNLFVSKYQCHLPSVEKLHEFLVKEMKTL